MVKSNDLLVLDLEGRLEDGTVFDSTKGELAKQLYKKESPILIIWGKSQLIPGLKKAIEQLNEGEEKEIILKPKEAFGIRKPDLIKIIPISLFKEQKQKLVKGAIVEINNTKAIVKSISNGRVMLDFNHPLSGKTVIYKVKLHRIIKKLDEKVKEVIAYMELPISFEIKEKTIELTPEKEIDEDKKALLLINLKNIAPEYNIIINNAKNKEKTEIKKDKDEKNKKADSKDNK